MKKIVTLLVIFMVSLFFQFCSEEKIDTTLPPPSISFPYETLNVDMNKIDNPPVVAFVKSESGLKEVVLKIDATDSVIDYSTTTQFFNNKAFTLSEKIMYASNFKKVMLQATDRAGKTTIEEMPLSVIGLMNPPSVLFSVDSIVYDELIGGEIDPTSFSITSDAGLIKVELLLATPDGQIPYMDPIELEDAPGSFEFSQLIEFSPVIQGLIVRATDTYNQVGITTLPYIYRELPTPEITLLSNDTIYAQIPGEIEISAQIIAIRGIEMIEVIRHQNTGTQVIEDIVHSEMLGGTVEEKELILQVPVDKATSGISIRATNQIGKEDIAVIKTFVSMTLISGMEMGTQRHSTGFMRYYPTFITDVTLPNYEPYLEVYGLLSLKDAKTYSMDYYIANRNNTANVDMKMNVNWDVNNAWYRLSGVNAGVDEGAFSSSASTGGITIAGLDASQKIAINTKFKLMDSTFDFDNATAASIEAIDPSSIAAASVNFYDSGGIIAFKTSDASTAGGGRVGVMKEVSRIPFTVQGYGTYAHQFAISVFVIKILNP